jgi:hypothetical protein
MLVLKKLWQSLTNLEPRRKEPVSPCLTLSFFKLASANIQWQLVVKIRLRRKGGDGAQVQVAD